MSWPSERATIVRHNAYDGWITREWVRNFDQLRVLVILEAIDLPGGVEPEVEAIVRETSEPHLDLLVQVCRERGWPRIVEHPAFATDGPRRFLRPSDQYQGDFPDADMDLSLESLRNACTYEVREDFGRIDPMDMPAGSAKALSWLNLLFEVSAYVERNLRERSFLSARCPATEGCAARPCQLDWFVLATLVDIRS